VRGTSQLGCPRHHHPRAEIRYDAEWHPLSALVNSIARGEEIELRTTFANGKASNEIVRQGNVTPKVDTVSADAVVLPNTFLGSYAALARRLQGLAVNAELRAYVAPQLEVPACRGHGQRADRDAEGGHRGHPLLAENRESSPGRRAGRGHLD
jgi:hypothetical protein